jgi:hypothetical protein
MGVEEGARGGDMRFGGDVEGGEGVSGVEVEFVVWLVSGCRWGEDIL